MRRIIKTPSNASISDELIIDYINRFWLMDVDARLQLFDLKTTYSFQTQAGVDRYNMPLYSVQTEPGPSGQTIASFPVYQGFMGPGRINGVPVSFHTERQEFLGYWQNSMLNLSISAVGNGTAGPYTINMPVMPNSSMPPNPPFSAILRGHVDMAGIIATGFPTDPPVGTTINTSIPTTSIQPAVYITTIAGDGSRVVVSDSGQFLATDVNYGLLMAPGNAPNGNAALPGGYSTTSNTINYFTGVATVTFPIVIPAGANINAQCFFFQTGLPRAILYYNNTITLRVPPSQSFLVELDAYLSPAAFLNSSKAIPFGYMAEYIARGAARKILSDTGDVEQFAFYEPLFREQEMLVWKRSQRQFTSTRTQTIYSQGRGSGIFGGMWNGGNWQ